MQHILEQLKSYSAPNVFNPWRDIDPLDTMGVHSAAARVTRLEAHFDCRPKYLLIGEAPGYQGAHFSGVAFTNEKLILAGSIPRVTWRNRITQRALPWSEPAATTMWRTLHRLRIADTTVMWNAFAWHPHHGECKTKCSSNCRPGDRYSNRTPTSAELNAGSQVLHDIVTHFHDAKIVAVGKLAHRALDELMLKHECVRHPSMGGAPEFAAGIERIVEAMEVV